MSTSSDVLDIVMDDSDSEALAATAFKETVDGDCKVDDSSEGSSQQVILHCLPIYQGLCKYPEQHSGALLAVCCAARKEASLVDNMHQIRDRTATEQMTKMLMIAYPKLVPANDEWQKRTKGNYTPNTLLKKSSDVTFDIGDESALSWYLEIQNLQWMLAKEKAYAALDRFLQAENNAFAQKVDRLECDAEREKHAYEEIISDLRNDAVAAKEAHEEQSRMFLESKLKEHQLTSELANMTQSQQALSSAVSELANELDNKFVKTGCTIPGEKTVRKRLEDLASKISDALDDKVYEAMIKKLKAYADAERDENREKSKMLSRMTTESKQLEAEVANVTRSERSLRAEVADLTAKLDQNHVTLESKKRSEASLKAHVKELVSQLTEAINGIDKRERKLDLADTVNEELNVKLLDASKKIKQLEEEIALTEARNIDAIKNLQGYADAEKNGRDKLSEMLSERTLRAEQLELELAYRTQSEQSLKEELMDLSMELDCKSMSLECKDKSEQTLQVKVSCLSNKLEEATDRVHQQQQKIESTNSIVDATTAKLSAATKKVSRLEDELQNKTKSEQSLGNQVSGLTNKLRDATNHIDRLEKRSALQEGKHLDAIQSLQKAAQSSRRAYVKQTKTLSEMSSKADQLEMELIDNIQAEQSLSEELASITSELHKTSTTLDCSIKSENTLQTRLAEVTSKLNDSISECAQQEQTIKSSKEINSELSSKISEATAKIQSLEEELRYKTQSQTSLGMEVTALTTQLRDAREAITSCEQRMLSVEAEHMATTTMLQSTTNAEKETSRQTSEMLSKVALKAEHLENELAEKQRSEQSLNEEVAYLTIELEKQSMQVECMAKNEKTSQARLSGVTSQLKETIDANEEREKKAESAVAANKQLRSKLVSAARKLKLLKEKVRKKAHAEEVLEEKVDTLTKELQDISLREQRIMSDEAHHLEMIKELKKSLATEMNENEDKTKSFLELEAKVEQLETELEKLTQSGQSLRKELEGVTIELYNTSATLDCTIKSEQSLQARMADIASKLDQATNEIGLRENKIESIEAVNLKLRSELSEVTTKAQSLDDKNQVQAKKHESLEMEAADLRTKLKDAKEDIALCKDRKASESAENLRKINELQSIADSERRAYEEKCIILAEVASKAEQLEEEIKTKTRSEESLNKEVVQLRKQLETMATSLECSVKSEQALHAGVADLTSKLNDAINECTQREGKIDSANALNIELHSKLSQSTLKVKLLGEELQSKAQSEQYLEAELEYLHVQLKEASDAISLLEKKIDLIEAETMESIDSLRLSADIGTKVHMEEPESIQHVALDSGCLDIVHESQTRCEQFAQEGIFAGECASEPNDKLMVFDGDTTSEQAIPYDLTDLAPNNGNSIRDPQKSEVSIGAVEPVEAEDVGERIKRLPQQPLEIYVAELTTKLKAATEAVDFCEGKIAAVQSENADLQTELSMLTMKLERLDKELQSTIYSEQSLKDAVCDLTEQRNMALESLKERTEIKEDCWDKEALSSARRDTETDNHDEVGRRQLNDDLRSTAQQALNANQEIEALETSENFLHANVNKLVALLKNLEDTTCVASKAYQGGMLAYEREMDYLVEEEVYESNTFEESLKQLELKLSAEGIQSHHTMGNIVRRKSL